MVYYNIVFLDIIHQTVVFKTGYVLETGFCTVFMWNLLSWSQMTEPVHMS